MARRSYTLMRATDWKAAMHHALEGRTRYEFIRQCVANDVCTRHTGECLLADDGTVTGRRVPSLETAIAMARVAGYDLVLAPRTRKDARA